MNKLNKTVILNFLKKHKFELQKNYGVIKIGLFGSYITNSATNKSDIDILVEMKKDKIFDNYFNLKEYLEKSFDKKIDLGIKDNLRELIKKRVEKEVIYV